MSIKPSGIEIIKKPTFYLSLELVNRLEGRTWEGFFVYTPLPMNELNTGNIQDKATLDQTIGMGRDMMTSGTTEVIFENTRGFVGRGEFKINGYGVVPGGRILSSYEISREQLVKLKRQSKLIIVDSRIY